MDQLCKDGGSLIGCFYISYRGNRQISVVLMSNQEAAIFMHLVRCYDVYWLASDKRSFMGPWLHKPCGAVITMGEKLNRAQG